MADPNLPDPDNPPGTVFRRTFIKGVIAAGAAASSAAYLFRAGSLLGQPSAPGSPGSVAHAVSGNLCRCLDYHKILDAMMRGAQYMRRA